jgi:3D (Asp-Asp-Asp) domain-containing protein
MRRIILTALALILAQAILWPVGELVRTLPPHQIRLVSPDTTVSPNGESWCLTVTGYSSEPRQTDSTPFITASNTTVRPGIIALSRDLLIRYTPGAPFAYGDSVLVAGQVYVVEDTMNKRWSNRADIWFPSTPEARRFGKQELELWRKA